MFQVFGKLKLLGQGLLDRVGRRLEVMLDMGMCGFGSVRLLFVLVFSLWNSV